MTTGTSKVEARRRAREATRRANEARAARDRANIENVANYIVAEAKLAEIDAWEAERMVAVTEHVRAEANKRRAGTRTEAGAAIKLLQENGEPLTSIAELTGDSISEVRAMQRHTPSDGKAAARDDSHERGDGAGPTGGGP